MYYYHYKSSQALNLSKFCDYLYSTFNLPITGNAINEQQGWIACETSLLAFLSQSLPIIEDDFQMTLVIVAGYNTSYLMQELTQLAFEKLSGQCLRADEVLICALQTNSTIIASFKTSFNTVEPHLLATVRMYLLSECNTQLTAQKMYLHRNTCLYRLNHFADQTGLDVRIIEYQPIMNLWFTLTR
jgi:hypothetical protein